MADKDDLEKTIAEDLVVTKYKMSAEITQSKFRLPNIVSRKSKACMDLTYGRELRVLAGMSTFRFRNWFLKSKDVLKVL